MMAKVIEATMQIDVLYGPYLGGRVRVSTEEGERAISEGWAKAAYPPLRAPPVEPTLTTPTELTDAADAAAVRWRAEAEPEGSGEAASDADQAKAKAAAATKAKKETAAPEVDEEVEADEAEAGADAEDIETDIEIDEAEAGGDEADRTVEAETSGQRGTYQTRHRGGRPPKRKG